MIRNLRSASLEPIPDFPPETIAACIIATEALVPELAKCGKNTLKFRQLICCLREAKDSNIDVIWMMWRDLLPRLEALCDSLQHHAGKKSGARKHRSMTAEEANRKAMELAKEDRLFIQRSQREWADAIGCSVGLVSKLPFWEKTMQHSGRQRKGKATASKVVRLTDDLEAVMGEGGRNDVLEKLIAQQQADYERSPLEEDAPGSPPKKVRSYPRL